MQNDVEVDRLEEVEDNLILPKPSLAVPIGIMVLAGFALGSLTMVMSDIGHCVGAGLGGIGFWIGALVIAWLARK